MALSAVLVSPQFLFRVEHDPTGLPANTPYRISDMELASRLSFFLWSSVPDDELLDLAAAGTLHTPAVLEKQVRRMLGDTRSHALVDNFAAQWLHLRNLDAITPDMRLFPDFDDNLRQAFRQETSLFFDSVLREDRSVLDLLRARYTFVNERLAKHYGIPHVYGSRFRRIDLDDDQLARRAAAAGERPDGHVVRHAHVAGRARQMGARYAARRAAPTAAARCADAEGQHGGRQPLRARAARGTSQEPAVLRRATT